MRMVYKTVTGRSFNAALSLTLAVSLLALTVGWTGLVHTARAVALMQVSDTLSDTNTGAGSNHTIRFTTSYNGVDEGEAIAITFPAGFNLGSITENDVDIVTGTQLTTAADCTGNEQAGVVVAGQTLTITLCAGDGSAISATQTVGVMIGLSASSSGTGANWIINPSGVGSREITITAGPDAAYTRVFIIDDVVMTAEVQTTFDFIVDGLATTVAVNGVNTTISTTSTHIGFGVLSPGVAKVGGHGLHVTTNAKNGFRVTVNQDHNMLSQTGADINLFIDGATTLTPVAWQGPAGTLDVPTSYGHYGVTSEDDTLTWPTAGADPFGASLFSGSIAQPLEVFSHTGPADGTDPGKGYTEVAYQIQIDELQEAATDYRNSLTYVATPTF